MSFRKLKTLLAVEQLGSFAAAADRLGLTQSAVSQQMRALEQEMSLSLFDRQGRSPRLTTDGRELCRRARRLLGDYQQLSVGLGGGVDGRLAIGATYMVQTGSLAPALADFRRDWPDVYLQVCRGMSSDLVLRVEERELDAVVTTGPPEQIAKGCRWQFLTAEKFFLVVSVSEQELCIEALLQRCDYIRFDARAWAGTLIDDELRQQGVQLRETIELDSLQAALKMIEHGLGVTIMPLSPLMQADIASRFRLLPFAPKRLRREVGFYWREDSARLKLITALLSAFRSYYA
ncbi:MAG: LysR family transcriptional regulator [Marinobacterium sp.]|nr:LysR family transcriptional regulator [Marinobacterium sp.]